MNTLNMNVTIDGVSVNVSVPIEDGPDDTVELSRAITQATNAVRAAYPALVAE